MAKKSKIAKTKKQQAMIAEYTPIRQALEEAGDYEGLNRLPKDAHPGHLKFHDQTDGRPRGCMCRFGMSRIRFHELTHQGLIPGVKKISW